MLKPRLESRSLYGVFTALITPFSGTRVNIVKMRELVSYNIDAGVSGIVPLGSTGESAALSAEERDQVITACVAESGGRVPVIVGAGTNNTLSTIANISRACELGADGALVVTPYYNKPTPDGLRAHFLAAADKSPLPIVLYHIPSRCGVGIPLELALELGKHQNIIGIKEAGGDVYRSAEIARLAPKDFVVLSGDDPLTLALIAMGAVGVISVVSNIAPRMTVDMVRSALNGNPAETLKRHHQLAPLLSALSLETNPAPIKEAMNYVRLNVGTVRLPLVGVKPSTRRAIRAALKKIGAPH